MTRKKINSIVDTIFSVALGLVAVAFVAGITFEVKYLGKVYPGIKIGGVAVGGLSGSAAAREVEEQAENNNVLRIRWGVNEWDHKVSDAGIDYNYPASVKRAMQAGRGGNLFTDAKTKIQAWLYELEITPVVNTNAELLKQKIQDIGSQIDVPAKEPEITLMDNKVEISAGENGQKIDEELLRQKIVTRLKTFSNESISVPVVEIKPKLSDEQIKRAKQLAEGLIQKSLIMVNKDKGEKWEISEQQMFSWIDLSSGEWTERKIWEWVKELAATFDSAPQNATFRFVGNGKVEEFKPASPGRSLQIEETTTKVISGLQTLASQPETKSVTVDLEVTQTKPEVTNDEVNNLGINEIIGKGESWFSGSINNRIFNLKKAAEALNGTLVAPGEIFSFNQVVGEISTNTGYKQAYIIKEGKTILGDGGGVCQVSSTLFRAVLAAGLPIEERVAHAYRVHYYEEKYQPGFDATVFQPSPDFKFKNDTQAYVLIQTRYDEKAKYLSFELYGTSDGRKVEMSKARVWEVTPPPPDLYQDDPTLAMGKVVQTEHAAWGAKVAFDWKVVRGEEILQERTFYSNYRSWQAVYLRGTKPI